MYAHCCLLIVATAFKNAKAYEQTINSLTKAANVQKKSGSYPFYAHCIFEILFHTLKIQCLVIRWNYTNVWHVCHVGLFSKQD